jgi:hypothetical protein
MNSVQRQFGKLTVKGAGNDAQVALILKDYDDADKMLTKVHSEFALVSISNIYAILIR